MPLYEYQCEACGERFEVIRKFSDPELQTCKRCGKGPVQRLLSSPAIQFKGTGWYITDYSQKGKGGTEKGGPESPSKAGGDGSTASSADPSPAKTETPAQPAKTSTPDG